MQSGSLDLSAGIGLTGAALSQGINATMPGPAETFINQLIQVLSGPTQAVIETNKNKGESRGDMFANLSKKRKNIFKRAVVAYMCAIGIPMVVLIFSFAQGGGWKPVMVGFLVYITIFGSITYQFIKELLALKQEEGEAEGPEKNGKQ